MFQKSNIKVLMVGGYRCGKTTAIASMFNNMINGDVNHFFTISNSTLYVKGMISPITGKPEDRDTLEGKTAELKVLLGKPNSKTFLIDTGPNYNVRTYKLRLTLPDTNRNMEIEFVDCPGTFFLAGNRDAETNQFVKESDVYVIMIDTPYLMEATKGVCHAVNCIPDVHNFLAHIDNSEGKKAKMVVFVPIKCEKWVKEGTIGDVIKKVEKEYEATITVLKTFDRMNICIIPIETAGNILFSEFKEAYTVTTPAGKWRCCKLSDTMIRLSDGTLKKIKPEYVVEKDVTAVLSPTDIVRPDAWYHINNQAEGDLYAPHNCEQLLLHIIDFITRKLSVEGRDNFWSGIVGDIPRDVWEQKQREIQDAGLLKEGVDGIKYIKRDI